MYQCIYCGNRTDDNNSPCTGCGSNDFKKYEPEKPSVITRPPQGGYTLKINNGEYNKFREKQSKERLKKLLIYLIVIFIVFSIIIVNSTHSYLFPSIAFLFILFIVVNLIIGPKLFKKMYEDKKALAYDHLSKHGILVKNLPYRVVVRDFPNHNYKFCTLEVKYEINGEMMTYMSHPFFDDNFPKDRIDLLYDPDNPAIHYIDFNIY